MAQAIPTNLRVVFGGIPGVTWDSHDNIAQVTDDETYATLTRALAGHGFVLIGEGLYQNSIQQEVTIVRL